MAQGEYTGFSFSSSFRTRYESKQDFNFNGSDQAYFLTQVRLDFDYRTERSNFFLQLQDARVFGESLTAFPPVDSTVVPNIFADQLDIHQGYYEYDFGAATLRAGRQKFNFADMRLVASLEWVNTARVHDGVRLTFGDADTLEVEFFASALVAVDPDNPNDQGAIGSRYFDSNFHGVFVTDRTLPIGQLEYWYFYRSNGDFSDEISTIGARVLRDVGTWELDLQGAYQFGDFGGLDHSAHMLHVSMERVLLGGRLGLAYSLGSGDDDPNDGDHGTFDNLFPLNHPYYGYMDLFSLQNVHNLELTFARTLNERVNFRVGWESFWLNEEDTDAWYNAGLRVVRRPQTDVDNYVGSELDVTVMMSLVPGRLALAAGVSRFFGGRYLRETGLAGDADFFFLQLSWTP